MESENAMFWRTALKRKVIVESGADAGFPNTRDRMRYFVLRTSSVECAHGDQPVMSARSRIVMIVASMVATAVSAPSASIEASAWHTVMVRPARTT